MYIIYYNALICSTMKLNIIQHNSWVQSTLDHNSAFNISESQICTRNENISLSCTITDDTSHIFWKIASNRLLPQSHQGDTEGATSTLLIPCGTYRIQCAYNDANSTTRNSKIIYISEGINKNL